MAFQKALLSLVTVLLVGQCAAQTYTDADIYNFALNLEYLEANFYHCAAYGTPITNNLGGPDPTGCTMGTYSSAVQNLFEELATDEMDHVTGIQTYLGSAAVAQPQIDLSAVTAAANAAFGQTLSPAFTYQANDITGLLSSFIFEDVGVTAYNGAAPLITSKTLLAPAVGIGLVEGYHAGIIRKTLFDMMSTSTGYGVDVGMAVSAISSLRGNVSAMASNTTPANYADEALTTNGVETIVPTGPYNIAFSRTPAEVLAIVYLGSASTPGGFFPAGVNGAIQG
ncbi:hypothetical protein WJX79_002450 [Trebouxia sp. C0005]|nr:MAG: hypothetical protein FRX49_12331 [Trebouxia sp. A1-2]